MRKQAVILGRIGILLPFGGFIPIRFLNLLFPVAGTILILIAFHKFSKLFENDKVFNYQILAFIINLIGFAIGFSLMIIGIQDIIQTWGKPLTTDPINGLFAILKVMFTDPFVVAGISIIYIASVISTYMSFKAYELLAEYTGVEFFRKAGFLNFIGAVLNLIIIGFVLQLTAKILYIVAYFTLEPEVQSEDEDHVNVDSYFKPGEN